MLSTEMVKRLNDQISLELYSSNLYLQMSAWAETKGLEGCGAYLRAQAHEEQEHMERLFKYVHETGSMPVIGAIDAPPTGVESVSGLFKQVYEQEQLITRKINELMDSALKENDHSTVTFLQWYVTEQIDEEHQIHMLLDQIENIGEEGSGVYFIDQAVGKMARKH